jgi:hypothetical protein
VTPVTHVTPVVLLAGMNCTQILWQDCRLENAIHPILDRPTITGQVDELLRTLPESFVLVGHSLGGIVGMARGPAQGRGPVPDGHECESAHRGAAGGLAVLAAVARRRR